MPARDKIHESVKKALTKDGWIIIYDPFRIDYQELTLFADLAAERIDGDQIEYKILATGQFKRKGVDQQAQSE